MAKIHVDPLLQGNLVMHEHDVSDLSATGTPSASTYLRGDGSWATPAGSGAVDSVNGATGVVVLDQDDVGDGTTYKQYSATEKTKLGHISITQAVDLDALETASHAAVTVSDSAEIDLTLTGQQISASLIAGSIDETKLDTSVNASLDLADSSIQSLAGYLTSATAASTYQPLMGADDNYVTDAQLAALHPAVTLGTNTASALSLSTQQLSIADVFVQNTGDTIAGDISINSGYRLGVGTAVSTSADVRINSTAVNESSLYVGLWQSTSFNPVGTPVAGTNVRGLLFQVSTPATADNLSNVILYGALGQVTHGGSGALGQAIGMNPGVFLTGSGNVTTSAGITLSATASGGGAHTTYFGFRAGGITLSGGSTMVNSYAFYADAVTGATNNYSWLSNAGLFVVNETGDASSDFRVESDTEANMLFLDANGNTDGTFYVGGNSITTAHSSRKGGLFFPVQAATASAPTYVKGALYFDTTLNKLRVGGATAWESITSA